MINSVLIVDDEPGIRDTLRGVLEDEGITVESCSSGEECLDVARRDDFSCILLDIWLGTGIDGLETLRRLKSEGISSSVVMIRATAISKQP
ncbi:MAG: response regulator [Chloracidobacterium sp.]|nr:response regulator [Chloracidobacterium sp.]